MAQHDHHVTNQNQECQIDATVQSWAVLSGAGDPKRATQAMHAILDRLVRVDDQLVLLFAPPFDKTLHDPGYIKGYPPGIRENGGQYTHAAVWTAWAFAQMGDGNQASALFGLLNPILHSDTTEKARRYGVEPYVIAADVYSVAPHVGRGGWTWYTGSASWMYRLGIEAILGLNRIGDELMIDPNIPSSWREYEMTYADAETLYVIHIDNARGVSHGVTQTQLDGSIIPDGRIRLVKDNLTHRVDIEMGDSKISPKDDEKSIQ